MHVLFVENDPEVARLLVLNLRELKVSVDYASSVVNMLGMLEGYAYDLVLLGIPPPCSTLLTLISRIRAGPYPTPILVLSDEFDPEARAEGFDLGADDWVPKWPNKDELLARMGAIVRRTAGVNKPVVRAGNVEIDLLGRSVVVLGTELNLTSSEYALLEALAQSPQRVVRKRVLLCRMGEESRPGASTLGVNIMRLRKKLAAAGADCKIETISGVGYMIRDPEYQRP